jgi:hypothetical protein
MFHAIVNARRLARLQRARTQASKDYDSEKRRLLASGLSEEEASNQAGSMHKGDLRATHTNVIVFQSDRLAEEAERLQVPVPEDDKYWIRLKYAEHLHLSEEGQHILRARVREEKKSRREAISFWFNIIAVVLSLLIAILALLK